MMKPRRRLYAISVTAKSEYKPHPTHGIRRVPTIRFADQDLIISDNRTDQDLIMSNMDHFEAFDFSKAAENDLGIYRVRLGFKLPLL